MHQRRWQSHRTVVLAAMGAMILAFTAFASEVPRREPECRNGHEPIGHLGITEVKGSVTLNTQKAFQTGFIRFLSEPEIMVVDPDGPCRHKIFPGDVIVAINDYLITTEDGARLFSNPPPERTVYVTIRRSHREERIEVVPESICPEDDRSIMSPWLLPPRPAAPDAEMSPPAIPPPPTSPPRPRDPPHPTSWLGFGLRCEIEGRLGALDERGNAAWYFVSLPTVISIAPGSPADGSGLKIGDTLTHLDGIPINTEEGSSRLSAIEPGAEVTWMVRRDRGALEISMVAASPNPLAKDEIRSVPRVDEPTPGERAPAEPGTN